MTQKGKRLATLLTLFGVTYLLAWGLSRDDESHWRAQVAKIREGMSETEVEAILFPHQHSKFAALNKAIDQYLLHRNHGLWISEGGLGIQTCYYHVSENLCVGVGYRTTPDGTASLLAAIRGTSPSTNTPPKFQMFVAGQAQLTHMNMDN